MFMKLLLEEIRLYLGETEIRVHERKLEIPQDVKLNVDGSWPSASNGTRRELTAPRPGKGSRKTLMNTETYDRISELWVPDSWPRKISLYATKMETAYNVPQLRCESLDSLVILYHGRFPRHHTTKKASAETLTSGQRS
jgi:hypothetical protein